MFNTFFPKIMPIFVIKWKKHGRAKQATDDNVMLRTEDAICMNNNYGKTTDTYS
jgi:hypothetical protein